MPRSLARDRLVALLTTAASRRVAVVGDAMLDVYLRGDVERISPEAPVPVVRVRDRRYALGGAGNVAQNVRAVGAACDLVAAVGDDAGGTQLRSMLGAIDANLGALVTVDRPTTMKTRIVARAQTVLIAGQKTPRRTRPESSFHLVERGYGRFARVVRISAACDTSRARASLQNGELRVSIPRIVDRRGRSIRIALASGPASA